MGAAKDSLNRGLGLSDYVYGNYAPQFADVALYSAKRNPAEAMFIPDWYYRAEDQNEGGMAGAAGAQQKLGAGNDYYDQWAQGFGDRMEPGLRRQEDQAQFLWENPGYTEGEKRAFNTATASPIASSYADAGGQMRNAVARTGNSAGYGSAVSELARQKARDLSLAGLNNQTLFGNARIQGQQFATGAQGAVNQARESALKTQGGMFGQGANMRLAEAGTNLERANTAQGAQQTMQGAQNLAMEPARVAAASLGSLTQGQSATNNTRQQQAAQPSFLKQLALGAASGLASGIGGNPKLFG